MSTIGRETAVAAPSVQPVSSPFEGEPNRRVAIGVMGSAGGKIGTEVAAKVRELGREIGRRDWITVTGACPGMPHEAVLGAKELGGLTVGISPALSREEHINEYRSPTDHLDVMVYTGSGLMGREITTIRSCDIVVIVGGRSGTLGEFAIAYDEGKIVAALSSTGGIADRVHELVRMVNKETGATVISDGDPATLLDKAYAALLERGGRTTGPIING